MKPGSAKRNPYGASARDVGSLEMSESVPRPLGVLIHSVVVACVSLLAAFAAGSVLDSFRELYQGFGADISASTRFIVGSAWMWGVLGACGLGLAAWVIAKSVVTRSVLRTMKRVMRAFTLVFGLAIAFTIYALYAPIFALGTAV